MAGYIKSHSNYRLQSRHQLVNDGIIFERDISTVGGVNSFATGQATIYQSGNFVMVINNTSKVSRNVRKKGWVTSGNDSDVWTLDSLSGQTSDINGSVEKSIMLKNDFMDLRSFAYYGSLADLIQNTVLKIVTTYPYELYYNESFDDFFEIERESQIIPISQELPKITVNGILYYYVDIRSINYVDIESISYKRLILQTEGSVILVNESGRWRVLGENSLEVYGEQKTVRVGIPTLTTKSSIVYKLNDLYREISNPGNIDIHNVTAGKSSDCNELGHFYNGGYTNYEIFDRNIEDAVDFEWESIPTFSGDTCPQAWNEFSTITIDWGEIVTIHACWDDNLNIVYLTNDEINFHIRPKSSKNYYDKFVDGLDLFGKCLIGVYSGVKNTSKFEVLKESDNGTRRITRTFTIPTGPGGYNIDADSMSMRNYISELGKIGIRYDENYTDNLLRMMTHESLKNLDWTNTFNGNDGDESSNEYIKTGEKFSSIIRVMGYTFDQEKAYIDAIGNVNTVTYSNRSNLSDYFLTDALEADGVTVNTIYPYNLTETGEVETRTFTSKGQSQVYFTDLAIKKGDTFEVKADSVSGTSWTLLYVFDAESWGNRRQWVTLNNGEEKSITAEHNISVLSLYLKNSSVVGPISLTTVRYSKVDQEANIFTRKFTENTSEAILPYELLESGTYTKCVSGETKTLDVTDYYEGQTYYSESGTVYTVMSNYHSTSEVTIPDVNNEFMKRFKINSKHILRKKGTIDGIESLLSLFGMRSKRWSPSGYDFDITEYTYVTAPIIDTFDVVHNMYKIDWYNSCKTIPYNTESYINGEYIPYQGLPVAYRDVEVDGGEEESREEERRLYPFFQSDGIYDGGMYYQMNGGWIGYKPYMFDIEDRQLASIYDDIISTQTKSVRVETMRDVMQVKNMTELINQPIGDLYDNIVYYVTDTSEKFALIDGYPYPIKEESVDGEVRYYFEVAIYSDSVSIGGKLYENEISINTPDSGSGTTEVDLELYKDGSILRIYYTGDRQNAFVFNSGSIEPESSLLFIDGAYTEEEGYDSHYFILKNTDYSGNIGEDGWITVDKNSDFYKVIENITDNTLGNNPHSGNFTYDNGEEYLNRYRWIFKYAIEYGRFNESCFADIVQAYDEMKTYNFKLEEENKFIDSKVHTFADRVDEIGCEEPYDINDKVFISSIPEYSGVTQIIEGMDGVTSQIVNTKNVKLTFYLHDNSTYGKSAQEEIKYIQCKIMPYVEQMLPSTSIVDVVFEPTPTAS